ncbi:MAG TPA: SigE family RNA polymerase sigma factor [Acidimicrobiales bacterium]|nr:SigE family RNA polymerase sigma factor [Acidimicrobiales bacterium]
MEVFRPVRRDEGFDDFFLAFSPKVLKFAERFTGNRATAEDVTAEAFARAYAHWGKVGRLAYRDAWVMRVASNLAIDVARRGGRQAVPVSVPAVDAADLVALRRTLLHALVALPKAQREAVVLRYLADLSEADVAAALGIRPGTVKSHLHRAVVALRQTLGADIKELGYDVHPA